MRKKYIRPSIGMVRHVLGPPIMEKASGGSSDKGGDIGTDGPPETEAKHNQFSSWEEWDE